MQDIKITTIQSDLVWENREKNLERFEDKINAIKEETDLIALPEMFSTGFIVDPARIAEGMEGPTFSWLKEIAKRKNCDIAGSILIKESGNYFNRLIWMQPDGRHLQYDKRHLFSFAGEHLRFTGGGEQVIVTLKGWKIRPLICYDLRFPVWSRNQYSPEGFTYDCLLYIANWPAARSYAWKSLLAARAIENMAYVVGVNRVGLDGDGKSHSGDSGAYDPEGKHISVTKSDTEYVETVKLSYSVIHKVRGKFAFGQDWDAFTIDTE